MSGARYKIIADNTIALGIAAQFTETLLGSEQNYPEFKEYMAPAEKKDAGEITKEVTHLNKHIEGFTDKLKRFYDPAAKQFDMALDYVTIGIGGPLAIFVETVRAISRFAGKLDERFSDDERTKALVLADETCKFAREVICQVNDRLTKFYGTTTAKYQESKGYAVIDAPVIEETPIEPEPDPFVAPKAERKSKRGDNS